MTCFPFSIPFSPWKRIFRNCALRSSFWIPPMMPTLSMNTAQGRTPHPLWTWTRDTPGISRIKTISPLTMTVSLSVSWAYACTKMDMRLPSTVQSTGAQKQTGNVAASVSIPVHQWNTAGLYTSLRMTIQGCLTYRQGTAKHSTYYV